MLAAGSFAIAGTIAREWIDMHEADRNDFSTIAAANSKESLAMTMLTPFRQHDSIRRARNIGTKKITPAKKITTDR
jgi:hypothetical protein